MNATTIMTYALAMLIATAAPGPAMLTVIARALRQGLAGTLMLIAGVVFGDLCLLLLALAGLAALAVTFAWLFAVIKYLGAAYLVWLGIRAWRSPMAPLDVQPSGTGGERDVTLGVALSIGNPKGILFHMSMMPLIIDLSRLTYSSGVIILAIAATINLAVMGSYALLAARVSHWFQVPGRSRLINRICGGTMIGTAAIVASR